MNILQLLHFYYFKSLSGTLYGFTAYNIFDSYQTTCTYHSIVNRKSGLSNIILRFSCNINIFKGAGGGGGGPRSIFTFFIVSNRGEC